METKTLSYLNSKAWYRLLKVIFIICVLAVCGIAVAAVFGGVGSYQDDYYVVCNYGHKETFIANKDKHIWNIPINIDYRESLASLPDGTKKELQSACGITESEMKAKFDATINGSDSKKLFELTKTKVYLQTKRSATLWSVLYVIIILAVFEIVRRLFYYVVLGKFMPKKSE